MKYYENIDDLNIVEKSFFEFEWDSDRGLFRRRLSYIVWLGLVFLLFGIAILLTIAIVY